MKHQNLIQWTLSPKAQVYADVGPNERLPVYAIKWKDDGIYVLVGNEISSATYKLSDTVKVYFE